MSPAVDADWIGRRERRFRVFSLRFEWGRMHYRTNALGQTLASWWVAESQS